MLDEGIIEVDAVPVLWGIRIASCAFPLEGRVPFIVVRLTYFDLKRFVAMPVQ